jgi:hypothetical protein
MRLANENASAKVTRCDATRRLKERCKAERVSIAGQTLFSRVEREREGARDRDSGARSVMRAQATGGKGTDGQSVMRWDVCEARVS